MAAVKTSRPLTHARLLALLRYNQETGCFVRLGNRKNAGTRRPDGYLQTSIDGTIYFLHRLAWFYVYGEWPSHTVDHINGDKADNRFANLRLATYSQNVQNQKRSVKNTSGYKGVHWSKACQKWQARIHCRGKTYSLGVFNNPEDAAAAYARMAPHYHGEFARVA